MFRPAKHTNSWKDNDTHTILSVFNNGANSWHVISNSSGLEITIDHQAAAAYVTKEFLPPISDLAAPKFGSVQFLDSGHFFIGWGGDRLSEYDMDGRVQLNASLPGLSYRTVTNDWTGIPLDPPDVWAYSLNNESATQTVVYVSWNGATTVATWAFYASLSRTGEFELVTTTVKTGFETNFTLQRHYERVFAEAHASDGSVLAQSPPAIVWSPGSLLARVCDINGCPAARRETREDLRKYFAHGWLIQPYVAIVLFLMVMLFLLRRKRRILRGLRSWNC